VKGTKNQIKLIQHESFEKVILHIFSFSGFAVPYNLSILLTLWFRFQTLCRNVYSCGIWHLNG